MVARAEKIRENAKEGFKVVVRVNTTLTCRTTATDEEINNMFEESDKTDRLISEWKANDSPWTDDDEAFLNRMSA